MVTLKAIFNQETCQKVWAPLAAVALYIGLALACILELPMFDKNPYSTILFLLILASSFSCLFLWKPKFFPENHSSFKTIVLRTLSWIPTFATISLYHYLITRLASHQIAEENTFLLGLFHGSGVAGGLLIFVTTYWNYYNNPNIINRGVSFLVSLSLTLWFFLVFLKHGILLPSGIPMAMFVPYMIFFYGLLISLPIIRNVANSGEIIYEHSK